MCGHCGDEQLTLSTDKLIHDASGVKRMMELR